MTVAILAGAAILPISLPPQKALAAFSDCGAGNICFWTDANYGGVKTEYYSPSDTCHTFSTAIQNKVSSVKNRTSHNILMYSDSNCNSIINLLVAANSSRSNLSGTGLNDYTESFW